MTRLNLVRPALCIAIAVTLLAGCASGPASQPAPVTSMQQLEGKWQGTITVGFGNQQLYFLTVHPDGSMVAEWGMNWQWGKIMLSNGNATFEMSGLSSGTIRYYEGPGGRSMTLDPNFGGWSVQVKPAR